MLANRRNLIVAALGSLAVCSVAQANSLSPFVLFWPGILHISLVYSLPATVFVAIVERDFFRRPADPSGNLLLSLRANLLSTIVGVLLIPASYIAMYTPFCLALPFAAIAISWCVELAYLRLCVDRTFSGQRILIANILSAVLLAVIPSVAEAIKEARPEWGWRIWDHWNELAIAALTASGIVLIGAWIVPYRRTGTSDSRAAERSQGVDREEKASSANDDSAEPQLASSK